jgi:hypothetical protein
VTVENPPGFLQAGTYSAEITRRAIMFMLQRGSTVGSVAGGIVAAGDCQVSPPGSGLSVSVSPGEVICPGSSSSSQSGYYCRVSATMSLTIATANGTNPRIDLVCATVTDAAYTGATNTFTVQVLTGTPTSGATLSNLSGAPSLPTSSLALGYVLVPTSATNIVSGDIKNVASLVQGQVSIANQLTNYLQQPGAFTNPSRTVGSTYQPNTANPTLVIATIGLSAPASGGVGAAGILTDPYSPPTGTIAAVDLTNGTPSGGMNSTIPVTFIVPAGWYYQIANLSSGGGTVTLYYGTVIEMTL